MAEADVEFGVLGPLEMRVQGALVPLGTPKQRAVLAMLLINPNRVVGIDALIDAVWDERPPEGAKSTVHNYVFNLRRLISGAGADPHTVLASVAPGYRLAVADANLDLGRFREQKKAGLVAAATKQFEQASRHLSAALAQWRGPALDDLRNFGFVEAFARAQAEDKLVVHTALAEAEIACGRAHAIIGDLEMLAAEHPYREPLWVQLITAYYLAEHQFDALDAYQRLKTALADDLGIDPGPTVRALYHRILDQLPLEDQQAVQLSALHTALDLEHDADAAVARLRDSAGRVYPLIGASTRIGRSSENDIVLPDTKVSRRHAVMVNTEGTFAIEDLGSANGVHVRGQRIDNCATLASGDTIRIGSYEFTFEM